MKLKMILFAVSAAMVAACVESAPATDVAEDELSSSTSVLAPICGDGPLYYRAWVCHWGSGWSLDVVGGRDYLCTYPYMGPVWGTVTSGCWTKDLIKCGGGEEDGDGDGVFDCFSYEPCPPKPSTYCYTAPPPALPPGTPPPTKSDAG
jgi:hypothetical protein